MAGKFCIFSGFKQAQDSANSSVILKEQIKHLKRQIGKRISKAIH